MESETEELAPESLEAPGEDESWSFRDIALAVGAFAVIIALAVGGFFFYQSRQAPPVVEGSTAPDFTLPLLNGGTATLSDYRGKVVLLNIWATWCNPCREEMPSMQTLSQQLKGKPFVILAASIDVRGALDVQPFVQQLGLTFPILLDQDKKLPDMYQTTGVPESLIIDKNGVIKKRVIGPADWSSSSDPDNQLIQVLLGQ